MIRLVIAVPLGRMANPFGMINPDATVECAPVLRLTCAIVPFGVLAIAEMNVSAVVIDTEPPFTTIPPGFGIERIRGLIVRFLLKVSSEPMPVRRLCFETIIRPLLSKARFSSEPSWEARTCVFADLQWLTFDVFGTGCA